jgi:hypothetical protein
VSSSNYALMLDLQIRRPFCARFPRQKPVQPIIIQLVLITLNMTSLVHMTPHRVPTHPSRAAGLLNTSIESAGLRVFVERPILSTFYQLSQPSFSPHYRFFFVFLVNTPGRHLSVRFTTISTSLTASHDLDPPDILASLVHTSV